MRSLLNPAKLVFGLLLLIVDPSPQLALGENYGAIAYSPPTANYGYSYKHRTRRAAENEALRRCNAKDARILTWERGLASSSGNRLGRHCVRLWLEPLGAPSEITSVGKIKPTSKPKLSTKIWRLRPFLFLAWSRPRASPPSDVSTD
ncbi:MAG: DUF4189 domain-containing protein [Gemmataceae bacterium]